MADWGVLTSHPRLLLCITHDPAVRLRDIAATTGVPEAAPDAAKGASVIYQCLNAPYNQCP